MPHLAIPARSSLDPRRTTCAWVESPLQALSVIEAHAAGRLGRRTVLTPRPGVASLGPTLDHLRGLELPEGLTSSERLGFTRWPSAGWHAACA